MPIQHIAMLPEFCIKNTYFLFQGKYYEKVQGVAMSSPISPLIANLFMEGFDIKALSTAPHSHLWLRFVDNTCVIQKAEHSQQLLYHINTHDPHMQFTVEETNQHGPLPYLDTQVSPGPNNTLITTVYRKPINTFSISKLGQQPFHCGKTQCFQHFATQAQNSIY